MKRKRSFVNKMVLLSILIAGVSLMGCGSSQVAQAQKPAVVDASGVETRENGTTIHRTDNGDK